MVKVVRKPNLEFKGLKVSQGNKKLQSNKEVTFLVWNINAVSTCPQATELCKKFCYAKKIERVYTNTRLRNEINTEATKKESFVNDMIEFLTLQLKKRSNKGKQLVYRIHESGDFYNREYMEKWINIANYFKDSNGIIFQAYTKSLRYLVEIMEDKGIGLDGINIHFTYSIWQDTKKEDISKAKELNLQTYEAFNKEIISQKVENEGYFECECINCGKCLECYKDVYKKIAIKIH